MNHPDHFPIDVKAEQLWLMDHKREKGLSWPMIASATGVPKGTISPWMGGNYAGDNEGIARKVFRYRQMIENQAERRIAAVISEPDFFETPTSNRIFGLLQIAHGVGRGGRITVGATGPGTGKTITMERYREIVAEGSCWIATMEPTTKTLSAMIHEVLRAVGGDAKGGWTRHLSNQVVDRVAGRNGLLIIDEAGHLEYEALEQLRAWHDRTKVGICLLGNEELMMRIRSGPRADAFGRLNSRIAQSHVQTLPTSGDVDAFCDAWGITNEKMRKLLLTVATTPGAGGLRECRQIVEGAAMLATEDEQELSVTYLRDAQSNRATRFIRT